MHNLHKLILPRKAVDNDELFNSIRNKSETYLMSKGVGDKPLIRLVELGKGGNFRLVLRKLELISKIVSIPLPIIVMKA